MKNVVKLSSHQVNNKTLKDCSDDEARQVIDKAGRHVSLLVCRSIITMPVLSKRSSFVDRKRIIVIIM